MLIILLYVILAAMDKDVDWNDFGILAMAEIIIDYIAIVMLLI